MAVDDADDEYLNELEEQLAQAARASTLPGDRRRIEMKREGRLTGGSDVDQTQLRKSMQVAALLGRARRSYDAYLQRPGQALLLGGLSLLVGFYFAGALSTIFGAAGFWEPVIAIGPLIISELISKEIYTRDPKDVPLTLRL